jgi:hypothetical protein
MSSEASARQRFYTHLCVQPALGVATLDALAAVCTHSPPRFDDRYSRLPHGRCGARRRRVHSLARRVPARVPVRHGGRRVGAAAGRNAHPFRAPSTATRRAGALRLAWALLHEVPAGKCAAPRAHTSASAWEVGHHVGSAPGGDWCARYPVRAEPWDERMWYDAPAACERRLMGRLAAACCGARVGRDRAPRRRAAILASDEPEAEAGWTRQAQFRHDRMMQDGNLRAGS